MWCSWSVQAGFGTMTRADLQRFSNSREAHHPQRLGHPNGSGPKLSSFHGTRNNICTPGRHPQRNSPAVTCLTTLKHQKDSESGFVPKMPFRFIFSSRTYLLEISIQKEIWITHTCSSMPISLDGGYVKMHENGSIIQHPSSIIHHSSSSSSSSSSSPSPSWSAATEDPITSTSLIVDAINAIRLQVVASQ